MIVAEFVHDNGRHLIQSRPGDQAHDLYLTTDAGTRLVHTIVGPGAYETFGRLIDHWLWSGQHW